MKRFVVAFAAVLAVVAGIAASVGASQPRVQLKDFSCRHAVSPIARTVSVWAWMRPVAGTRKLQERWTLLSRSATSSTFSPVSGSNLETWVSPSDPTLGQRSGDVWKLHKSVADLAAPAWYRLQATFRWLGAGNRVLGSAQRSTATCFQPELRPDLQVLAIAVKPARNPANDRYVATIVNAGATAAGPFNVLFAPGGGRPVDTRPETGLRAHGQLTEAFIGPACSSTAAPTVTADPAGAVNDYNRSNNQMTAVCPTPAG
jgi:CARDB